MTNGLDYILRHVRGLVGAPASGPENDGDLLERFVTLQDHAAFTELVRRHGSMVHGVCRRVLANRHDADDACQATFLVLATRAAAVRKQDSVASWLYGVAYRVASKTRTQAIRREIQERRAAS